MLADVRCPHCDERYQIPQEYTHRKICCPYCKDVFRFEDVVQEEEQPEPSTQPGAVVITPVVLAIIAGGMLVAGVMITLAVLALAGASGESRHPRGERRAMPKMVAAKESPTIQPAEKVEVEELVFEIGRAVINLWPTQTEMSVSVSVTNKSKTRIASIRKPAFVSLRDEHANYYPLDLATMRQEWFGEVFETLRVGTGETRPVPFIFPVPDKASTRFTLTLDGSAMGLPHNVSLTFPRPPEKDRRNGKGPKSP